MTTKYYAPFKKDGLGAQLSWLTKGCERRNREAARRESGFATVLHETKQNKTKQNKTKQNNARVSSFRFTRTTCNLHVAS